MSTSTDHAPASPVARGAHLVGSVNLPDAETVLRTVSTHLGDRLYRIPDGEVGERFYWVQFQTARFDRMDGLARIPGEPRLLRGVFDGRPFRLEPGWDAGDLVFKDLNPGTALQRVDGFRYLTQNLSQAFDLALETRNTKYPAFQVFCSPTRKLGSDNADCIYIQAWIDGDSV